MTFLRPTVPNPGSQRDAYRQSFNEVRAASVALAAPLSPEDQCIQSMPDASPTKWHLAHSTWFFETVLLQPNAADYVSFDPRFQYLFNSYYEALGPRAPRPQRGLVTRPSNDEVMAYRRHVDAAVNAFLENIDDAVWTEIAPVVALGLQHEQQHQELLVTDILHAFSCNPLLPAYRAASGPSLRLASSSSPMRWLEQPGGVVRIGSAPVAQEDGGIDFAFDNETPRHDALLRPYAIGDRLVDCGDYLRFIEDGGYRRPSLWLSDGWAQVQANGWQCPAYWLAPDDPRLAFQPAAVGAGRTAGGWHVFGLHGVRPLEPEAPVAQLSFCEAAAYAEWAGARLPTEFEWEAASADPQLRQATGHVWQWTRSSYDPYPGFRPMSGIAAEYNGKFMVGQVVLRGGSVATPPGHARPTYRNFFPPAARWQFTGLRLARDL